MARKKEKAHENHERWLVSYADFITLLFAFFVVIFASSQTDKGKAQKVSESVKRALEGDRMPAVVAAIFGGTIDDKGKGNATQHGPGGVERAAEEERREPLVELVPSLKIPTEELKKEIESGQISNQHAAARASGEFQSGGPVPARGRRYFAGCLRRP